MAKSSHYPSEIICIFWFAAQETFIFIGNVKNSCCLIFQFSVMNRKFKKCLLFWSIHCVHALIFYLYVTIIITVGIFFHWENLEPPTLTSDVYHMSNVITHLADVLTVCEWTDARAAQLRSLSFKFLFSVRGRAQWHDDFMPLSFVYTQQFWVKVVHAPGSITVTRQSSPFVGDDSTSLIYNGKDIILLVLAKSSNVRLFRMPALPCSQMNKEKVTFCLLLNIPA